MKDDEKQFLIDVYNGLKNKLFPRYIINQDNFYMNYKRAWYLLEKWSNKGWYDYGVTLDLGWVTDKGENIITEMINIKEIEY